MVLGVAPVREAIKVVVIEDHEATRQKITDSFSKDQDIMVVGEAAGSEEAITLIGRLKPDVAIVDIRLRDGSGIDVSKAAKIIAPNTKILVLTAYDDEQYVRALAKLGVCGYLVKAGSTYELSRTVRDIAEGWLIFAPQVAVKISGFLSSDDVYPEQRRATPTLTARETEVLQHVASGLRNSEIAEAMTIAVKTVEAHMDNILLKLSAKSRTEAVMTALRRELIRGT